MSIRRLFFDWSRPALRVAAAYLAETYGRPGTLDLEGVVVAVPGGRAGRRLLEILVELAEGQNLALVPPRIVTAGGLPELLYDVKRPLAGELAQQLAWIRALKALPAREAERLAKRLPDSGDLAGWLALAQMFAQLHRELAADALDFSHVLKQGAELDGFLEAPRWRALAALQKKYLRTLDDLNLWDKQTARLVAIERRLCRTESDIVLLATVDIDRAQRAMLDQVADRVTALVFAPQELAGAFDAHGCLIASAWRARPVELARDKIEIADAPADQADAALRAIAAWDGAYAADQITVGVPDERVVPYLEERFAAAGVPARFGAGTPLARSAPALLLSAVAQFLDQGHFRGLAALVRHPDLEPWFEQQGITDDYLTALDNYYSEHLPAGSSADWLGTSPAADSVRRIAQAVAELVGPLAGDARPLAEWTEPILALLVKVYGHRELDRDASRDRMILETSESAAQCLTAFRQIAPQLAPRTSGAAALRLVLDRIGPVRVPARPEPGAVEMLGWLELPLDDAVALVVVGMNEGIVPASRNGDLFLPDRLRTALALEDNDRRYARDNYALSVLAASRRALKLIAGRRTGEGDPLVPSRLLLACPAAEMAERARIFFSPAEQAAPLVFARSPRAGKTQTDLPIPRPVQPARPIDALRVTQFRDYLACPYRYYLRHVLGLQPLGDALCELGPPEFGTLVHRVLKAFADGPQANCTSVDALRAHLDELLDATVLEMFGPGAVAAVQIQAEQIRLRLAAFAAWQAPWRGAGWRIHSAEHPIAGEHALFEVDGQPLALRGRIDRIDVHERGEGTVVFDYKTGDAAQAPDKVHRAAGEWVDLQLPLYRHMVLRTGLPEPVRLGYILLPKDTTPISESLANWSADELAAAEEKARQVIRDIRAGLFWPRSKLPQRNFAELAAICQEDRFGAVANAADDAEGSDP